MPPMTNLEIANLALTYVKKVLPYGSDNREEDKQDPNKLEKAKIAIRKVHHDMNEEIGDICMYGNTMSILYDVEYRGMLALKEGAGNCDEQAAVCFNYFPT